MCSRATYRVLKDFQKLAEDPPAGLSASPFENDLMIWKAIIVGPADSPFEDGIFKLTLEFSKFYPEQPPTVKFDSKIFHPNIFEDGSVCLDLLQEAWSPVYDVTAILLSIQSLLGDPNPNSAANLKAAKIYTANRKEFKKRVRECVEKTFQN